MLTTFKYPSNAYKVGGASFMLLPLTLVATLSLFDLLGALSMHRD